jgi:hypothetical protein
VSYLKNLSNKNETEGPQVASSKASSTGGVSMNLSKNSRFNLKDRRLKILLGLLLLLLVAGAAYSFWSWNRPGSIEDGFNNQKNAVDEYAADINEGPKIEPSPLNGVLYTKARAEIFRARRPIGVVLENHVASRPPYGLENAEIVFEAVAEGGITRFVAFYQAEQADRLEPIRSAREYFLHWVSEFDALFVHHGGASSQNEKTDALGNIERYGIASMDCIRGGGLCERDNDRFAPHNSMSSTHKLWQEADKNNLNKPVEFELWKFKDDAPESERPLAQSVRFNFWEDQDYIVRWVYDQATNRYLRWNGGDATEMHVDALTNNQIDAKNVIVMEMGQRVVDDGTEHPHLVLDTIGSGNARVFMDGKLINATWRKGTRTERTKFFGPDGAELEFNRGDIWIAVIPVGNVVTVQ